MWQGSGLSVDAFDFTPHTEASYRVKMEGMLLDDELNDGPEPKNEDDGDKMEGDTDAEENVSPTPRPKLSHLFRAISVTFDKSPNGDGSQTNVEWKKAEPIGRQQHGAHQAGADFDEFTFKRNGDENQNITFHLYRHETPERYQLSPELVDIVDMNEATRQVSVMGLWV